MAICFECLIAVERCSGDGVMRLLDYPAYFDREATLPGLPA